MKKKGRHTLIKTYYQQEPHSAIDIYYMSTINVQYQGKGMTEIILVTVLIWKV